MSMARKTGRYRLRPDGNKVVLQVEESGIFGPQQRYSSTRWRDAAPIDLADLVHVEIKPQTLTITA